LRLSHHQVFPSGLVVLHYDVKQPGGGLSAPAAG
jgi:hypothetical protein